MLISVSMCALEAEIITRKHIGIVLGLYKRVVGEVVWKFTNLNIVKRDVLKDRLKFVAKSHNSFSVCTIWYSECF